MFKHDRGDLRALPGHIHDEEESVLFCWIPTSIPMKRAGQRVKQGRGLWSDWAVHHRNQRFLSGRAANTDAYPPQTCRKVIRIGDQAHVSHRHRAAGLLHLQQRCCSLAGSSTVQPPRTQMLTNVPPAFGVFVLYHFSIIYQQQGWDLCSHELLLLLRRIFVPSIVSGLQLWPLTLDLLVSVDLTVEARCCFYLKFRLCSKTGCMFLSDWSQSSSSWSHWNTRTHTDTLFPFNLHGHLANQKI